MFKEITKSFLLLTSVFLAQETLMHVIDTLTSTSFKPFHISVPLFGQNTIKNYILRSS
jgi:hypothetical protein